MNEEKEKSLEEKDVERIKLFSEYDDGTGIGVVNDIRNVNVNVWKDFKMISRLYGNNEGAALTAVVHAWLCVPVNLSKISEMKEKIAIKRAEALEKKNDS